MRNQMTSKSGTRQERCSSATLTAGRRFKPTSITSILLLKTLIFLTIMNSNASSQAQTSEHYLRLRAAALLKKKQRQQQRKIEGVKTWNVWPDEYVNCDTGKSYEPHHEDERKFVYEDGPSNALARGGEGSGKSVAGIIKDLNRLRRGCTGIMVSP